MKRGKNQEMWLHHYIENKIGVSIIDSIQHCRSENALERDKYQEMWLRFYLEDKTGVCIIDSIPHCLTENVLKMGKKSRNVASLLYRGQKWSIYHR